MNYLLGSIIFKVWNNYEKYNTIMKSMIQLWKVCYNYENYDTIMKKYDTIATTTNCQKCEWFSVRQFSKSERIFSPIQFYLIRAEATLGLFCLESFLFCPQLGIIVHSGARGGVGECQRCAGNFRLGNRLWAETPFVVVKPFL